MLNKIIFEVGLVNNGLSVIRRQFIDSSDLSLTPILVGELLSVIQNFSEPHHHIIPEVVQVEEFTICLHRFLVRSDTNYFLLYVICRFITKEIRETLRNLATELMSFDNILVHWNLDTESIRNIYPLFDEAFIPFNR
jgi:hypothetical protein